MAFFEQEFIEIKRENYKMNIVGTLTGSMEQEDVRQYIIAAVKKEKRAIVGGVITILVMWFIAAIPVLGELVWSNKSNPHLGPGTIILTAVFSLIALYVTVLSLIAISNSKRIIATADPDSPEQLKANAPDAVIWKQKKQWEMCYSHDLVPLESALKGQPVFLEDGPLYTNRVLVFRRMNAAQRSLREREERQLTEYAASLMKSRTQTNEPLMVYLDIDKLDSGVYGRAAGKALGRVLPASELEGIAVFSGDSAATLNGSANEYVVAFAGDGSRLDRIEALLRADKTLAGLLSSAGICRGGSQQPLVADGTVRNGELAAPAGHSFSFCAAGFNDAWKGEKS